MLGLLVGVYSYVWCWSKCKKNLCGFWIAMVCMEKEKLFTYIGKEFFGVSGVLLPAAHLGSDTKRGSFCEGDVYIGSLIGDDGYALGYCFETFQIDRGVVDSSW